MVERYGILIAGLALGLLAALAVAVAWRERRRGAQALAQLRAEAEAHHTASLAQADARHQERAEQEKREYESLVAGLRDDLAQRSASEDDARAARAAVLQFKEVSNERPVPLASFCKVSY